jgi:hypothetical protein
VSERAAVALADRLAHAETVLDGRSGWLFDPGSSEALTDALEQAASSNPWDIAERVAMSMREAPGERRLAAKPDAVGSRPVWTEKGFVERASGRAAAARGS